MESAIQIAGAILILIAFIAAQRGTMAPDSRVYLVLNLIGGAALAVLAGISANWGFLLLEGTWAVVSAVGLVGALRGREA